MNNELIFMIKFHYVVNSAISYFGGETLSTKIEAKRRLDDTRFRLLTPNNRNN